MKYGSAQLLKKTSRFISSISQILLIIVLCSCSQEQNDSTDESFTVEKKEGNKSEEQLTKQDTLKKVAVQDKGSDGNADEKEKAGIKIKYRSLILNPFSPTKRMRIEIRTVQSDYLVLIDSKHKSVLADYPFKVPKKCQDYYSKWVNKMDLDSLSDIFSSCVKNYYSAKSDSYRCDTICVEDLSSIGGQGISNEELFFATKSEIYNADTSEYTVTQYYSIDELKNVCIKENFRKKSIEEWRNGKKHGVWKRFNKNGTIAKLIEYNMGTLVREESY